MKDSTCKTKLKYLHRFLRYFGNRQTNRQMQAKTLSPARKAGDNDDDNENGCKTNYLLVAKPLQKEHYYQNQFC